jgi:hypothetical protein
MSFLVTGCDPVRTTLQHVSLQVMDAHTRQPVADADVLLTRDLVPDEMVRGETTSTRANQREAWDHAVWHACVTDRAGKGDITIMDMMLDRTIGDKPPTWRDRIAGYTYLVRVRKAEAHENFRILMKPGATAEGRSFGVAVLAIDKPSYID